MIINPEASPSTATAPGAPVAAMAKPARTVRFQIGGWSEDKKTTIEHADLSPASASKLSYFTCTLGQAAKWNEQHPHPFQTVNHLIDAQANELRQRPAVNFPGSCYTGDGRAMKTGKALISYAGPKTEDEIHKRQDGLPTVLFHSRLYLQRAPSIFSGRCRKSPPQTADS